MNFYSLLANLLILAHIVYVAFVVFGQAAILIGGIARAGWVRNPWFRGIHLWMTIIVAFEAAIDYECPLSTVENELRVLAGEYQPDYRTRGIQEGEDMGFISRMLRKVVLDESMTETLQYCFLGFGLAVLGCLVIVPPRHVGLIVVLNVCCLALLYTCYLYAGRPNYWGHGDWGDRHLVCAWNVLPFLAAAGAALYLRGATAASLVLCGIVLVQCAFGLYFLHGCLAPASAASFANRVGASMTEALLPLAYVPGILAAAWLARRLAKPHSAASSPSASEPASEVKA
jgi:hypothetical protein